MPSDTEEPDLPLVSSGYLPEAGLLGPALTSPGSPEVQDDGKLTEVIGEGERVTFEGVEREVMGRLEGRIPTTRGRL